MRSPPAFVVNLARPGGNVTRLTDGRPGPDSEMAELRKEGVPRTERVAVLVNPDNPTVGPDRRATETRAPAGTQPRTRTDNPPTHSGCN
jgi:hypothetical protein